MKWWKGVGNTAETDLKGTKTTQENEVFTSDNR